MALGGGIWAAQNKVLPGTYINFSSVAKASSALSERGYAAMPLLLDWGPDDQVFTVTGDQCKKDSLKLFGHAYTDDAMLPLRELFRHARTLYAYRLNGGGKKAENTYCTAKYSGEAGNRLSTVISKNVDNDAMYDVSTYYDTTLLDMQTVKTADELAANDFVVFKSSAALSETAKTPLTSGTNGTGPSEAFQTFLDRIESYSFNTLGCPSKDVSTVGLFVNFTKRMRDEHGAKFQTVIYNPSGAKKAADYEGVIEVGNKVTDYGEKSAGIGEYGLVYWMTGASAGCAVNSSNTNKRYDGELTVDVNRTQTDLKKAISEGRLMFHNVNGDVRILEDINSLVTISDVRDEGFRSNQTIRVCDQIANDIAVLFGNRYLGIVPNDASGRVALWNDICKIHQELEAIRAIEAFDPENIIVEQGETKKSVLCTESGLNIVGAMAQLYMSVIIM